jgi:hypothetical protein
LYEPDYLGYQVWLKISMDGGVDGDDLEDYFYKVFKKEYPHSYLRGDNLIRVLGIKSQGNFTEFEKTIPAKFKLDTFWV